MLLPYTQRTVTERPGGRGGGRGEGRPPRGEGRGGEDRGDRRPATTSDSAVAAEIVGAEDVESDDGRVDADVVSVGDDG